MSSEVKWIKIKVGMFDGESFKRIKRAKIGGESYRDKLTAVWFELMDFAGKCNHSGALINSREIPFKDINDIAVMIDREPEELSLCIQFFLNDGMLEIIDDIYMLSNWTEYQNVAGLERIREQKRISQAKWREGKRIDTKHESVDSTVDSTQHLPSNKNKNKIESINTLSSSVPSDGACSSSKSSAPKYDADCKYLKAASWLADDIHRKLSSSKPPTAAVLQKWADDFRKLEDVDGIGWGDIRETLLFARENEFWSGNILSAGKFRKNYNAVRAKLEADKKPKTAPQGKPSDRYIPELGADLKL